MGSTSPEDMFFTGMENNGAHEKDYFKETSFKGLHFFPNGLLGGTPKKETLNCEKHVGRGGYVLGGDWSPGGRPPTKNEK